MYVVEALGMMSNAGDSQGLEQCWRVSLIFLFGLNICTYKNIYVPTVKAII